MTTTTNKPFDAYLRVSDKDGREGDSYHSPTDQLDDIVLRAPSFGIASIAERVLEEDVSGRKAAEERKSNGSSVESNPGSPGHRDGQARPIRARPEATL